MAKIKLHVQGNFILSENKDTKKEMKFLNQIKSFK